MVSPLLVRLCAFSAILALTSAKVIPKTHGFGIINGTTVDITEVPYQAYVTISINLFSQKICGGSVISKYHILTAGHCVYNQKQDRITVALGTTNRYNGQKFKVAEVTVHEKYKINKYNIPLNDVAILTLTRKIMFSKNVHIIPLALPGYEVKDGTGLIATGWGITENGKTTVDLKKVTVPALSFQKCFKVHGSFVTKYMLCAGEPGKDTCQGDSGGPLVEETRDGKIQVGITSWGIKCGKTPGVYTKISEYYTWIIKTFRKDLHFLASSGNDFELS